ncbi:MAG: SPOR domain-containing protein, partial [Gammaproteobacteria bacterium]
NEMYTNQIHQASNGIPAKINIVARQVLLDYDPKNKKRKQAKQPKLLKPSESTYVQRTVEQKTMPVSSGSWVHTLTWLTTGAVIVVVIILFMVVYFKVPSNSKTTTQQVAVHKTPSSPASDNKEVADNDNISQADIDEEQTQAEGLNGMVAKKQPASETSPSVQNSMPATTMTEASEANSTSTGDDTANVDSSMQSQSSSAMSPNTQESTASSSAATAPDTPEGQDNSSMWVPLTTTSQAKTDEGSDNNPLPLSEPLGATSSPTQTTEATAVSQPAQSTEATSVSQPAQSTEATSVSQPVQLTESTSPAEPAPTPSTKVTPPPVAHKTVKPITNNAPVSNKMAVVSSYSLTSDEQALMEADANRYTVQIAAAANYYKLRSYIKSVGLEGQVYFFQTLNAGNPWYVVVYGDFNNAAAAKAAISKLPSVLLAKEKPWARSFGSVQKAIKAK